MPNKRIKRRTYFFFCDSSVLSIAVAKDSQLSDDGRDRQGDPAPDGLLKIDNKVCTRSARLSRRVRKAGPGISHRTKLADILPTATKRKTPLLLSLLVPSTQYSKEAVP